MTSSVGNIEDTQPPAPPTPETLARRLLAYETGATKRPEELTAAGERTYLRLREHLAVLLGSTGFDALWTRAMHLAEQKFRAGDNAAANISFPTHAPRAYGLYATVRGRDSDAIQYNLAVAFASFMTLLFTFIGQELGLRFMYQIWPDLPPEATTARAEEPT